MTQIQKNELYDRMCRVLTEWEHVFGEYADASDLYDVLVEIQNNWGELTAKIE